MHPLVRSAVLSLQKRCNGFDSLIHSYKDGDVLPPIFVVGAPRTGSTALYQLMIKYMRVAYISNIMALMPSHMLKIGKWSKSFVEKSRQEIRDSDLGYIGGLFSPNECGPLFRKWFDEPESHDSYLEVKKTFDVMSQIFGCPVLIKNMYNSLRMEQLKEVFPNSSFIFLKRDPLYTAQSLILSRRKLYGNDNEWWSIEPPGYEEVMKKDPFYQVTWQVHVIESAIQNALVNMNSARYEIVEYETLCDEPVSVMKKLAEKFQLQLTFPTEQVTEIKQGNTVRLTSEEWQSLERCRDKKLKIKI